MIQRRNSRNDHGFTLVELMIAMAFIAFLLLAIAGAVMQIGSVYNKGVTLKSVNQAGRAVVTDMKQAVAQSQPFDTTVVHNRLCTGVYTYVWNTGLLLDQASQSGTQNTALNKYDGSSDIIRLVKVRDRGGKYCQNNGADDIAPAEATELLSEDELAVQDLKATQVTDNAGSGSALYSITITISNADQGAIDTVAGNCKPPSDQGSYQDFCAVNIFDFTAQAGDKGGQ